MEPGHKENTGSTTLVMYYLPLDIPKRGILNILTTFTTRVVVWNKNDFKKQGQTVHRSEKMDTNGAGS